MAYCVSTEFCPCFVSGSSLKKASCSGFQLALESLVKPFNSSTIKADSMPNPMVFLPNTKMGCTECCGGSGEIGKLGREKGS